MLEKLLIIAVAIGYLMGLEVIPENLKISYVNPKYIRDWNITYHQYEPHGLYYWSGKAETLVEIGDNVVNHVQVFLLGDDGKYHPTPINLSGKSCEFLEKDKLFGKGITKIMAKLNFKCPLAAGKYEVNNFTVNPNSFPEIGLLVNNRKLRLRTVVESNIITDHKELLANGELYTTVQPNKT